jgi:hypothetical protein
LEEGLECGVHGCVSKAAASGSAKLSTSEGE